MATEERLEIAKDILDRLLNMSDVNLARIEGAVSAFEIVEAAERLKQQK